MEGVYMQTISVEVKDNYVQNFISYAESNHENLVIANNEIWGNIKKHLKENS